MHYIRGQYTAFFGLSSTSCCVMFINSQLGVTILISHESLYHSFWNNLTLVIQKSVLKLP